ncbi:hypothetical protein [Tahibacter soli]|uniref:DUF1579 domain-containing protein n=1 Tax=Tahibacter soli TaxID=2983605 RepID=A0A9X4BJ14_9GAMM|nr:hypothetical protein [Tahibacter soli]MDC8011699.1 hypothetical protein [Tahibacter soli]
MKVFAFLLTGAAAACALPAFAQPANAPAQTSANKAPVRDGSRDFDPIVGTWKAKLKRLKHPLSGSNEWVEFEGTQITKKVWDGRGTMDEFHVDSPETGTKIDGFTLRLYNPTTGQWHIYWANAKNGKLDEKPVVGEWKNGVGEFYDQEYFDGRAIFVRYVWSDVTPTSAKFVQSFSADGGKTWEPNWISTIERVKE